MAADEDSDEEHLQVDRVPRPVFSNFIYLFIFFMGLGSFLVGYDGGNLSGALIFVKEDFALNYGWQSALVSATISAAGVSCLIAGFLAERFGRKPVMLCASFVFALSSILTASASNVTALLAGRVVVGIAIGMVCN